MKRRLCRVCGFQALKDSDLCWRHYEDQEQVKKTEQRRRQAIIQSQTPEPKVEIDDSMSPLGFEELIALLVKIKNEVKTAIEKMKTEGHPEPEEGWEKLQDRMENLKADALHIGERRKAFKEQWERDHRKN